MQGCSSGSLMLMDFTILFYILLINSLNNSLYYIVRLIKNNEGARNNGGTRDIRWCKHKSVYAELEKLECQSKDSNFRKATNRLQLTVTLKICPDLESQSSPMCPCL